MFQLRQKTCTKGVTEYRIVYGTIVLYEWTILSEGLDSISLKCLYQVWYMELTLKLSVLENNNVVLNVK